MKKLIYAMTVLILICLVNAAAYSLSGKSFAAVESEPALLKSKAVLRVGNRQPTAKLAMYPLPGVDDLQINIQDGDTDADLKREIATAILNADILPQDRLAFFEQYKTRGCPLVRYDANFTKVEEIPEGYRVTIEVKLIPGKIQGRRFAISTLLETYEMTKNGVKLVNVRPGTCFATIDG